MKTITLPPQEIPIVNEVDVLVAGGGPAGIGAAASSAREGLNTMLVEQYGFLGGMWTAGLVNPIFEYKNKGGVLREVVDRLTQMKALDDSHPTRHTFDPEMMKYLADNIMDEADVRLLYHTFIIDSIVEKHKIKGVAIANKSGTSAILADIVIDCTGDGDVAAKSGAPYEKGRPEDGLMQPMSMMFRVANVNKEQKDIPANQLREIIELYAKTNEGKYKLPFGGCSGIQLPSEKIRMFHLPSEGDGMIQFPHLYGLDGTDAAHLTKAEIQSRRQVMATMRLLQENFPEFSSNYLVQTPVNVGVRETRRIMGEYLLTMADLLNGRRFEDGILTSSFGIDIHNPSPGSAIRPKSGKVKPYQIPYRCLVPRKIDNLLVAGRCISGTHEAHASYRVTGNCMAMGEAVGMASALCLKDNISPRELDGKKLKKLLQKRKILLD